MAQKTAWTGAVLTESDIDLYLMHEGGAWTSWTPAVVQSVSVTTTNTRSRYARASRLITVNFNLTVTGTGTAANEVTMTLPATAAASNYSCGTMELIDTSAGLRYPASVFMTTTTTVDFRTMTVGTGVNPLGLLAFTAALAVNDTLNGTFTYESAT